MVKISNSTYNGLVQITQEALGDQAESFILELIENHLDSSPETLKSNDIILLKDWLFAGATILSNNRKSLEIFKDKITDLSLIAALDSK